ncbi:MBL fold metallo-hydrolase [bacterium]|nr:MAG: MBL fold metallo-hydrolase [bacterium]
MRIRCWGSRGSIAVSGKQYLKYGGDTACIEVRTDAGEIIIIDAGTGIRALGNEIVKSKNQTIHLLLSHAHWDHLSGFPFFKPIYKKDTTLKIYGPQNTRTSLKCIISKAMTAPYFPIEFEDINAKISLLGMGNKKEYDICGVKITTIPISHPNEGAGYRLEENGKSFVFLTDNELTYRHKTGCRYGDYVNFSKNADVLFHDSEYTRQEYKHTRKWGHSVYLDTLSLALEANVKTFGLYHHNQERTDKEVDAMVQDCKRIIAKKGSKMKCFAVATGTEIKL